ncbi:MAG: Tar ligand binding domain-containing protein [Rhodospirillaceae bacterium]
MNILANISISKKISLIIAIMAAVSIAIGLIGYAGLANMGSMLDQVALYGTLAKTGARMNQNLIIMNRAEYRMGMDPSEMGEASQVLLGSSKQFEERLAIVEKTFRQSNELPSQIFGMPTKPT